MELQTVAAITAEYNPFHKGHAHQINVIRKTLGNVPIIAVMSGSVTQRGELALWDKWERARLALRGRGRPRSGTSRRKRPALS